MSVLKQKCSVVGCKTITTSPSGVCDSCTALGKMLEQEALKEMRRENSGLEKGYYDADYDPDEEGYLPLDFNK